MLQSHKDFCDVHAVVEGCCHDWQQEAAEQGVTLNCTIASDIPVAVVDGKQLGRVFANLVANAVKFTPRGGRVAVSAVMEGRDLCFRVNDTGIGISAKDISRIFNKYYRSDRAVGFKGTGLGLTIAKAMVEDHNGTVSVESTEGDGSTFTVRIPLAAEE
jgi:signal transduction histidine kinase